MLQKNRPYTPNRISLNFGVGEDDVEQIILLPDKFPYFELLAIGDILQEANVFVPGYHPPPIGLYHPNGFIFELNFSEIKTTLLPDRNIISRMVQVSSGSIKDSTLQKVAAIKAFCQLLDIQIEPSIAFHELAHSQGNEAANYELARFRDADQADPQQWLDFTFGDIESLTSVHRLHNPTPLDLAFPLKRWNRNYIAALKIAELELSDLSNLDRIRKLLSWMRDDFLISGPAICLACIYFAPYSPPRKGLFKQLRSKDRLRALYGIKNAAWDLTHLSDMLLKVSMANEENRFIFASFDDGLRHLFKLLFTISSEGTSVEAITNSLKPLWSQKVAENIAKPIVELMSAINGENRLYRQTNSGQKIEEMIVQGELPIISWN